MDAIRVSQYVLSGVVIGIIYSLMALGITFIYSIMKMINWAMGEFFMIGSYVQYALIVTALGPERWWLALPAAMGSVFVLGLGVQPPTPDLGTMVSAGAGFLPDYWWQSVLPGLAILFVAMGFNLLGDGLRDALDPRLRV